VDGTRQRAGPATGASSDGYSDVPTDRWRRLANGAIRHAFSVGAVPAGQSAHGVERRIPAAGPNGLEDHGRRVAHPQVAPNSELILSFDLNSALQARQEGTHELTGRTGPPGWRNGRPEVTTQATTVTLAINYTRIPRSREWHLTRTDVSQHLRARPTARTNTAALMRFLAYSHRRRVFGNQVSYSSFGIPAYGSILRTSSLDERSVDSIRP
jgi:hypothetical protein